MVGVTETRGLANKIFLNKREMAKKLKFTWDEFYDSVNGDFEKIDSKVLKGYINPKNKIIKKSNKSNRTWYSNLIVCNQLKFA